MPTPIRGSWAQNNNKKVSLGIHNIMDIFVWLQFLDNVKLHVGCHSAITVGKWIRKYVPNMMKEYNLQSCFMVTWLMVDREHAIWLKLWICRVDK